jgi:hypothetical protein
MGNSIRAASLGGGDVGSVEGFAEVAELEVESAGGVGRERRRPTTLEPHPKRTLATH